ncbi:leucyl aminopeptidase family protein [Nocardioides insulae]|uniref:leucyl aminopeptidase family protein n=1 Tax=Nocardioides insulae TaxID=394734 RepID=UPI00048BC407|nr:leucyl aminopeptidase family protein [Nocardioides insulae]
MSLGELPAQVTPPRFTLAGTGPDSVTRGEVIAVPVLPADESDALVLGPGAAALAEELDLLGVLEVEGATGKAGEVTTYVTPSGASGQPQLRRILLVGVGAQRPDDFRRAGAAVARVVRDTEQLTTTIPALDPDRAIEPFVAGLVLGSFTFVWRAAGAESVPVAEVRLAEIGEEHQAALGRAVAIATASWQARRLATTPSNIKNPPWLAEQAAQIAAEHGLTCTVWDETQLAEEGFGGLVGVGQASVTPPRLIRLDYAPAKAKRSTPTVVLVGKGITFDSGGLSIKPGEGMRTMKRDMTGGGVVISTMAALAQVGCPVKVVGLIAAAENAVSGNALRPGDVVRHYDGRTSEVTNTDAEGRLVMADALAYAVAHLQPAALVDIATLTGAMKVALGQNLGGYFADDDALAGHLESAGLASGEPVWRMPLTSTYADKLASKIADADNAAGGPGAITAALFLQAFTGEVPWAHLDIASVGDAAKDEFEWTEGPTGFGARLLLTWLGSEQPLSGVGG